MSLAQNLPDERHCVPAHIQNLTLYKQSMGSHRSPVPIQRGDSHGKKADCLGMTGNRGAAIGMTALFDVRTPVPC